MKCQDGLFRGDDRSESGVKVVHREHGRSMYSIVPISDEVVISSGQDRFIVSSPVDPASGAVSYYSMI